jgi:hypothetical protein
MTVAEAHERALVDPDQLEVQPSRAGKRADRAPYTVDPYPFGAATRDAAAELLAQRLDFTNQ